LIKELRQREYLFPLDYHAYHQAFKLDKGHNDVLEGLKAYIAHPVKGMLHDSYDKEVDVRICIKVLNTVEVG